MRIALAAFFLFGMSSQNFAFADFSEDTKTCNGDNSPELKIAACTRLLVNKGTKNEAIIYQLRAYAKQSAGYYDDAIKDYDEAIKREPNKEFYALRGMAWGRKGNYDKAFADLDEAIRLDPQSQRARLNRSNLYVDLKEWNKALSDLEYIRKGNLDLSKTYYNNRAYIFSSTGNFDRAITEFTLAIKADPNASNSYALRGQTWQMKGDLDRALEDINQQIVVNKQNKHERENDLAYLFISW